MNVLFISSGNKPAGISPLVKKQGKSLIKNGISLDFFTIVGKGLTGYLKNIPRLRKNLHQNKYNLIHAHYSLSAITATLASPQCPIIVSLMGSDIHMGFFLRLLIKLFNTLFWERIIVKSQRMKNYLRLSDAAVIPNGIDLELFREIHRDLARKKVGLDSRTYIMFIADPHRSEKNYSLAESAVNLLNDQNTVLLPVYNRDEEDIPFYINSADVILLTSLWEGSPNVIKESMACNVPVVATDVGDIRDHFNGVDGCYLTSFDPHDIVDKLKKALAFQGRTNGRHNILWLDENKIAQDIISLYEEATKVYP